MIEPPCTDGGSSSVGRALDCDSGGRGFKPRLSPHTARMVELVDTLDLESSAERHGGSSPPFRILYSEFSQLNLWAYLIMIIHINLY